LQIGNTTLPEDYTRRNTIANNSPPVWLTHEARSVRDVVALPKALAGSRELAYNEQS
jgi:hypothetical protein